MDRIRIEICGQCGPMDEALYHEYLMAGELIEHQHGDSDTGQRLQAALEECYACVTVLCPQCAYQEALNWRYPPR